MLTYNKTYGAYDVSAVCCISGKGGQKVAYNSQAEAGAVANRLGSKVYQCRVNPNTYHITTLSKPKQTLKASSDKIKDIKSNKRRTEKEIDMLLTEVDKELNLLYRLEDEAVSSWTKEQLDEFYRREQELLDTENILTEELEDEDIWLRAMKNKH